ncbi:hypothetical protein MMC31_007958, partial [Peltigera leucophlebia]|nr:hypothetical protein [Peltigera leucophlebia]
MKKRGLLILFGSTSTHRAQQHHHKRPVHVSPSIPQSPTDVGRDPITIRQTLVISKRYPTIFPIITTANMACQAQAISDYLADTNDPSNQRISATGSSLPPLTGPFESRRTETSMLVSASGCGSSTGGLPGLSSGGSVGSLEGSISSKIGADQLSRSTSRLLSQVDGGGLLVLPRRLVEEPIFECPFYFVECNRTFTDEDEWFEHSLAHFKEVGPPTSNECPFCDRHNGRFTHPEPMESW